MVSHISHLNTTLTWVEVHMWVSTRERGRKTDQQHIVGEKTIDAPVCNTVLYALRIAELLCPLSDSRVVVQF